MAKGKAKQRTDDEVLGELIAIARKQVKEKLQKKATLGELLIMMETRRNIRPGEKSHADFWKMMDRIRAEALGGKPPAAPKKPTARKTTTRAKGK